jgi:hypothetical protein
VSARAPQTAKTGAEATPPAPETDRNLLKRRRRWPWLTPEDHQLLVELDAAGRSDIADAMEAEIRSQCDLPAERDHLAHELPESALAGGSVEWIASERAARASHGAGGGRRRQPPQAGPDA